MNHAELLTLLLPKPYEATDPVLAASLAAEGAALDAAHASVQVVAEGISPAGADGLWLADWERVLGLPDTCAGGYAQTQAERIAAALSKMRQRGGQSRAYFIGVAKALGYEITIEEHPVYTCASPCNQPICDEPWSFVWTVRGPAVTVREFTCQSGCADPLASWGNALLECLINRLKPAHTHVIFAYGNE
ncbi:YmfQ family protein [Humidesulfovibrio idahonensis]